MISALLFNIASYKNSLSIKALEEAAESEEADETVPNYIPLDPEWVAWSYLLNPYTIITCSGKSLGILCNIFVLAGIFMAVNSIFASLKS